MMLRLMKASFCQAVVALALVAGCAKHGTYVQGSAPVAGEKSPYNAPLTTPGAKFGALPAVVQNTVRTQVGMAELYDVRKEDHEGQIFYKISFSDSNSYPPLLAAVDGSVLNPDLTVAVSELRGDSSDLVPPLFSLGDATT